MANAFRYEASAGEDGFAVSVYPFPRDGNYVVRLNSKTGDVVKAFAYTADMPDWERF